MVTCKTCGAKVSDEYGYCTNCLAPFDVEIAAPNTPPACRVCFKNMTCLDTETQRWYCYDDDQTFLVKENRWEEPHLLPPAAPVTYSRRERFVIKILKRTIIAVILVNVGIFLLSFWLSFLSRFVVPLVALTLVLFYGYVRILAQSHWKRYGKIE